MYKDLLFYPIKVLSTLLTSFGQLICFQFTWWCIIDFVTKGF